MPKRLRSEPPTGLLLPMSIQPKLPELRLLLSWLEAEPVPMMVMSPDYTVLGANAAYRQQFAEEGRPWLGRKCFAVSHGYEVPCDQAGEHCPMKQARETQQPDRVLHIHHTPGGPAHVDVTLSPLMDDQGQILGYVERLQTVRTASARSSDGGLVGCAPSFVDALAAVQRVAPSLLPVLLLGESGSGKELFARAVHEASPRADRPFVAVDCSGLTDTLFESELFGHERGAFTGAHARKPGLIETAQGGTLFLDELGDVPGSMQVKLLRWLETGTFRRVGGVETLTADVRVVAATHRPLAQMVEQGRFRQDLYYRLNAFPIRLPPLRERQTDIPLLARALLQRLRSSLPLGGRAMRIAPAAMRSLIRHDWPGNIRELRNVLERACLLADAEVIETRHLPPEWERRGMVEPEREREAVEPLVWPSSNTADLPESAPERGESMGEGLGMRQAAGAAWTPAELQGVLARFRGSRRALAAHLGWSERSLYRRLRALSEQASASETGSDPMRDMSQWWPQI